jgi:hypothetical protein
MCSEGRRYILERHPDCTIDRSKSPEYRGVHSPLKVITSFATATASFFAEPRVLCIAGLTSWTTVDRLWPLESAYGYAFGNPITYVDPNGTAACQIQSCDKYPQGICAYAKHIGADKGDGGGVVCCNGVKTICSWGPDGPNPLPPGIAKCVLHHESTHLNQLRCPPNGFARPDFDDRSQRPRDECLATAVEWICLKGARSSDCGKLHGSAQAACNKSYHRRFCQLCKYLTKFGCQPLPSECGYCPG